MIAGVFGCVRKLEIAIIIFQYLSKTDIMALIFWLNKTRKLIITLSVAFE